MRTCVIFNPAAKGGKARHFRGRLGESAPAAEFRPTTHAGHGRELARAAVEEGFGTVVAAGGDGTANEALNGIGDAEDGFDRARLGLIPLGTINLFALELGVPFDPRAAWEVIQAGRERRVDLPSATFQLRGQTISRHFLQVAGAGWDARAVEKVSWALKQKIGRFAYVWSGLLALRPLRSKVTVRWGEQSAEGDFAVIGNGRFYAGKFPVLHRADLGDGLLDLRVIPNARWSSIGRLATDLLLGRYFRPGALPYFQANGFALSSESVTPLQLDGEFVGHLPTRISVRPRALRVIAP